MTDSTTEGADASPGPPRLRPMFAIWNPAAGNAPDPEELARRFGDDVRLLETTEDDPGPGQARQAVADGAAVVAVCGGDGTIRACAQELVGTDTSLALVPLGTGNLLGANLGVPSGLDAIGVLDRTPETIRLDVGRVNGEAFVVMAGTGYDADMIGGADSSWKSRVGSLAYVQSALANLRRPSPQVTVIVDDETFYQGPASMVLVGNQGEVTGGVKVFPDARADDGRLDVLVTRARGITGWGRLAINLLRGRTPRDLASRTTGTEIEVRHGAPQPWELDGETRDPAATLSFSVEPSALSVVVPGDR